jgi:fatty acid desaturase
MSNTAVQPDRTTPARPSVEWATVALAAVIYGAFGAVTWFYHALPLWLVLPLGAYLVAWHGSLQHEAIHHHPTHRRGLNELLVFPNLWLWMPYRVYRDTHLAHHRDERLTDPLDDPESYYMTAAQWQRCNRVTRALMWVRNTLLGRLAIGPAIAIHGLLRHEIPRLLRGKPRALKAWGLNGLAWALVLAWVVGVCNIPVLEYIFVFAYPAISLTLLRSFAEHRAEEDPANRSVIIDACGPLALLFLNNNLHALHHREPGLAWYRLPERYRKQRDTILQENGGYRFGGYWDLVRRYLVRPKEGVVHPGFGDKETG